MITLMLLLCQAALAGAPWVRGPGEAYTKMGWSHFRADASVAPGGLVLDDVRYQGNSGTFYGEVGLAKWAHAVVLLPFSSGQNRLDDVVFVNRGFGDGLLGVVLGAPVGSVPVSLTLRSKLPLYDNAELLRYGDAGQRFPALGDGQVDLDAVVSAGSGISLGPVRGWVMGELGYRHRTEWWMGDGSSPDRQLADGMLWTAQLGWSPRWRDRDLGWLFVQGDGVGSMVDDAVTRRLVQLSSGVGVKVWKGLAVELGGSSVVWAGSGSAGMGSVCRSELDLGQLGRGMHPHIPLLSLFVLVGSACSDPDKPVSKALDSTTGLPAPGWGAVFWRDGKPWHVGDGEVPVGPRAVGGVTGAQVGPCGGRLVDNAPDHAVLVAPAGAVPESPRKPPVVAATMVESAAWRLDEVLPAAGAFAPVDPDAAPTRQRGVEVGSVIKQRRDGGPPVNLAVGARECTGAVVLLDHTGLQTLDSVVIPEMCGPVRALPPADLDGLPGLETAVFDATTVVLMRIQLTPATAALEVLGSWSCPAAVAR